MDGTCEEMETEAEKATKRPPGGSDDLAKSSNKKFRPNELNAEESCLLKDCVNIPEVTDVSSTASTISVALNQAVTKEITLDDEGEDQVLPPNSENGKDRRTTLHKRKITEEEKISREEEKRRKAEERRVKLEMALAAKQLRQKQKEEAAEARRLEKEKKEREREENRRRLEEKRKLEEELKRQREMKRKEEEERRERKRKEEEEKRERKRLEEEEKRERKRREEEAEELWRKRISNHFMSFFSKKERISQPVLYPVQGPFRPFEIKEGMTIAPIHRRPPLTPTEYECLLTASIEIPYLSKLPCTLRPKRNPMKAKLFQFHDNYRPPYYGTWRKRSDCIKGRRPFAKDEKMVDYEIDSDEEWEEDDEGDDCDEDDVEDEEENEEEDDGFFVDHGYLSAGEGDEDDEPEEIADERRPPSGGSDEIFRKNRLKAKAAEWEENLNQKFVRIKKLRPILYGPVFCSGVPDSKPPFLEPIVLFEQ